MTRPIVFVSDYGLDDEFVGTCHGVIARIAPEARIIDLTHAIPARDIRRGALVLRQSVGYMPEDAIFLAVVDPGVGTKRRAVAVRTGSGQALVGPDNGLLWPAWEALGGAREAVEITSPDILLTPVSATFHGRDVFAPAAAHLALGVPLAKLGPPVDPSSLARLDLPEPRVSSGEIATEVLSVDRFGNAQLGARPSDLEAAGMAGASTLAVHASGMMRTARRATTFGDLRAGTLALIVDSSGWLALVVNGESAAEALRLRPGDSVALVSGETGSRGAR